jgi:glycosyltransferase involved in cell wall biosynthesis
MKALLITNLFPQQKHGGGSFIVERVKVLKSKFECDVKYIPTYLNESKVLELVRKTLRRFKGEPVPIIDIQPTVLGVRIDTLTYLRKRFFYQYENLMQKVKEEILKFPEIHDYDIIYAHGMYSYLPAGWIAKLVADELRIPYVVHLHGSDVNYLKDKLKGTFVDVLENASKCVFVSNALLEKAKSYGYSGKNAVVTGNGYDPTIFRPMNKEQVRKELGIYEEGKKYVGFVGALRAVKRSDKFPEIFKYIASRVENVKFVIVGDGELRKRIEKEMKGLDYLITGLVPHEDVAKWMNAMDVMILPSRSEGFGTVNVEAQACGVVTVGSDAGGIPEAIGFEDLVVVEGEDFERRFAQKVVEVLENGYDTNKLLKRVENWTWEKVVEKEYKVCEEVVKNSKSRYLLHSSNLRG